MKADNHTEKQGFGRNGAGVIRKAGMVVLLTVLVAGGAVLSFKGADLFIRLIGKKPQTTASHPTDLSVVSADKLEAKPSILDLGIPSQFDKLAKLDQCLALLKQTMTTNPGLVDAVLALLEKEKGSGVDLQSLQTAVMVIAYRQRPSGADQVVVQLFLDGQGDKADVLTSRGYVHNVVGGELADAGDRVLGLIYRNVKYLGAPDDVQRFERAFTWALDGDMTLLREQTVEPLNVMVIVPQAYDFLPVSIRSSVQSMVAKAELTLPEWRGQVELLTPDRDSAKHVGRIVLTWREMAMLLAAVHAGAPAGQPLRGALKASSVNVVNEQVLAVGALPAKTVVRSSKEISGHGMPQVTICHNGHTIQVPETAVPAHLAHGDTLGPCNDNGKVVICHEGQTMAVEYSTVPAHLAHGDTLGPCNGNGAGNGNNNDRGNNGLGNGLDPQPPGNPPVNDGPGTQPGAPGN